MSTELKHTITFENEDTKVDAEIRLDDIIQISELGEIFAKFEELKGAQTTDDDFSNKSVKEMLEVMRPIKNAILAINVHLDNAFYVGFSKNLFKGSYSLEMYDSFFEQLGEEMNKAGIKREEYVKRVRKEYLTNDYKKGSVI